MIYYHMKQSRWTCAYKVYSIDTEELFSNHKPKWIASFQYLVDAEAWLKLQLAQQNAVKQARSASVPAKKQPLDEEAEHMVAEYRGGTMG